MSISIGRSDSYSAPRTARSAIVFLHVDFGGVRKYQQMVENYVSTIPNAYRYGDRH